MIWKLGDLMLVMFAVQMLKDDSVCEKMLTLQIINPSKKQQKNTTTAKKNGNFFSVAH